MIKYDFYYVRNKVHESFIGTKSLISKIIMKVRVGRDKRLFNLLPVSLIGWVSIRTRFIDIQSKEGVRQVEGIKLKVEICSS